jgi:hypothetical protein
MNRLMMVTLVSLRVLVYVFTLFDSPLSNSSWYSVLWLLLVFNGSVSCLFVEKNYKECNVHIRFSRIVRSPTFKKIPIGVEAWFL